MQATIVPPGFAPRGLAVIGEPPRPRPPNAKPSSIKPPVVSRPVPYAGQDPDPLILQVTFGFRLWVYVLSLVAASLVGAVIAYRLGGGSDDWPVVPGCVVWWALSLAGVLDYARRGART